MTENVQTPRQLEKEAKAAYQRGEYLAAASAFTAASQGYLAAGEALSAAEMANNACVSYLQAEDGQAALDSVAGTDETFAQAGDLKRQGMALGNQAAALEMLERNDEAIQTYLRAGEILLQAGEDELRLQLMQSLSMLQLEQGRRLEALASMQSGLEEVRRPSPKHKFLKKLIQIPFDMLNKPRP